MECVALVTGGARRVGRAIVCELADAGCDIAIHYHRSRDEAHALAAYIAEKGRRAMAIQGDLNNSRCWPATVERTVDELGRLDVLINNASVFVTGSASAELPHPDTVEGFDLEQWESVLRTNLVAPMALCHYARTHLEKHGRGRIINLCDIAADRPWASHLAYCASKAALTALTKGLAKALAPRVTVNGVAPGIAVFPSTYSEDLRKRLVAKVPLGRAGTPEEVARVVRFLIESADYITGQIIPIDGGRSIV